MNKPRKDSTTDRTVSIVLIVLLIAALAFCTWAYFLEKTAHAWTEVYTMTNQRIVWEGAGYQPLERLWDWVEEP